MVREDFCDICKRRIGWNFFMIETGRGSKEYISDIRIRYDLCRYCYKKIRDHLKEIRKKVKGG